MAQEFSFVTCADLMKWTTEWVKFFPADYDLIVGIPRSGLMVASIIATKLAKPLATPESILEDRLWGRKSMQNKNFKSILLVDDSINHGKAMKRNFELLLPKYGGNITTAALLATEASKNMVDLHYKIIPKPRIFEWNLLHTKRGKKLAVDMDGVLCENCPPGVDADEKLYVKWLENARPYLIPTFEIDVIISNRLEKYRPQTEKWLQKQNVRYKELILWDIGSKKERNGIYAQNKINAVKEVKPDIFWESSVGQAKKIWEATRIPIICIDKMVMVTGLS